MFNENSLYDVDFSKFSKVKDSLLAKLQARRRMDAERMELEELDYVVAAGNVYQPPQKTDLKDTEKPLQ